MYEDALVFDGHVDTPLRIADDGIDFGVHQSANHVDLPRMIDGGLDAVFMAAWVDPAVGPNRAFARARDLLSLVRETAAAHPARLVFATTADDVVSASAQGRIALLAGVENGDALEERIANVERLYHNGARYLTLTWMHTNALGDAAGGERVHGGLSPFGRDVVEAMNDIGMLVDVSHAAPSTFWDVLQRSKDPIVVSHSATEAYGPHPRNVSDDQLRAIADNGGLVGINFFSDYLTPGAADVPDWTVIVDHLERIIEVAGVEHAALGSDMDGVPRLPAGFSGVEDLPLIGAELERRGQTGQNLRKILGGNWLRVLDTVVNE
ncbi:MAG: dipeptidase [Gemmatimonadetes bacterium]|nr:dipeptidase [Gemmatimonadota bacterium]